MVGVGVGSKDIFSGFDGGYMGRWAGVLYGRLSRDGKMGL